MKTVKNLLAQGQDGKTKAELVAMLVALSEVIGMDEYGKVSGIDPKTELNKLSKKELLAVAEEFNENYNPLWEEGLSAGTELFKDVKELMDADDAKFTSMAAGDSDFVGELNNIDFENLIGGPLNAAVSAQNNASLSTVNFIKEVGFKKDSSGDRTIRMVDFSYFKDNPNKGKTIGTGEGQVPVGTDVTSPTIEVGLKVPFLSIINVPTLRIETVDIDFNVKLNSVYTKNISSEFGVSVDYSKKVALGSFYNTKFKVSASYKRQSSSGVKVEKEYSLNVKVKATNDEMPAGLEKVLGILSA